MTFSAEEYVRSEINFKRHKNIRLFQFKVYEDLVLSVHKPALWSRYLPAEFLSGFYPFVDNYMNIFNGFFISLAVRHASGQFGSFGDKTAVFFAPIYYDFVFKLNCSRLSIQFFNLKLAD